MPGHGGDAVFRIFKSGCRLIFSFQHLKPDFWWSGINGSATAEFLGVLENWNVGHAVKL